MSGLFDMIPFESLAAKSAEEIYACNSLTVQYGLKLSHPQIITLMKRRFEALNATGRMEVGEGILKKLVVAFCDSPNISQEDYADTLAELQDMFYYFKNESLDSISDDELIELMKTSFDGECEGSLDYLRETVLENEARKARFGFKNYE